MKLFSKKEKDPKDTIGYKIMGDIYLDSQKRAGIALLGWFIFLAILVILIRTGQANKSHTTAEQTTTPKATVTFTAVDTMLEDLSKKEYEYTITVSDGTDTYYYTGTQYHNQEAGTYTYQCNKINYYYDGSTYLNKDTGAIITNLYDHVDPTFFDITKLTSYLTNIKYTEETIGSIKQYTYSFYYHDSLTDVIITTSPTTITKTKYIINNQEYNIIYSNINNVSDITLAK